MTNDRTTGSIAERRLSRKPTNNATSQNRYGKRPHQRVGLSTAPKCFSCIVTIGRKLAGNLLSGVTHGALFLVVIREGLQISIGGRYYATLRNEVWIGMMKSIDVVAAIIEQQGKILLARRPGSGDQAGLWEFPGGKVDANESQPAALTRELEEELAIKAVVGDYVASHQREVSGRIIHLHAWHVSEFSGELTNLCHSELVWCLPAEAFDYPLAPADIPLLNTFMALHGARLKGSC